MIQFKLKLTQVIISDITYSIYQPYLWNPDVGGDDGRAAESVRDEVAVEHAGAAHRPGVELILKAFHDDAPLFVFRYRE